MKPLNIECPHFACLKISTSAITCHIYGLLGFGLWDLALDLMLNESKLHMYREIIV